MAWDKKPATPAVLLQREVIVVLNSIGFVAWINKANAVWDQKRQVFRKNVTGRNGISDVLGYQVGTGRFLAVELKASKGDKLTDDQVTFLQEVTTYGGLAVMVRNMADLVKFLFQECPRNYERLDQYTRRKFETKNLPPKPKYKSDPDNVYPESVRKRINDLYPNFPNPKK